MQPESNEYQDQPIKRGLLHDLSPISQVPYSKNDLPLWRPVTASRPSKSARVGLDSTPGDHLASCPDAFGAIAPPGRASGASRPPRVGRGIVLPSGIDAFAAETVFTPKWVGRTAGPDNHLRAGPHVSKESPGSGRVYYAGRYPGIGCGIIKAARVMIAKGAIESLAAPYKHFVPGPNGSGKVSLGGSIDQTGGRPRVGRGIIAATGLRIKRRGRAAPDNH